MTYVAKSGSLTLPAGQRVRMVSVVVRGDRVKEGNEPFLVDLSGAGGAALRQGPAKSAGSTPQRAARAKFSASRRRRISCSGMSGV